VKHFGTTKRWFSDLRGISICQAMKECAAPSKLGEWLWISSCIIMLYKKAKLIESKANTEKQSFQWITTNESMNTKRRKVHLFCVRYSASQGE